jgi:soluble lytic murein transglycosylase-like protein
MSYNETSGRGLVTLARLAFVTIIIYGSTASPHISSANTLSSGKTGITIAVPSSVRVVVQDAESPLDKAMDVLTPVDARLYAAIFAAQKKHDWPTADAAIAKLGDRRLMGHVLAQRYTAGQGKARDLIQWMTQYGDHPEADSLDARARELAKAEHIPYPEHELPPPPPPPWSGLPADAAPSFPIDLKASCDKGDTQQAKLAQKLTRALRHKDPSKARDLLVQAQNAGPLAGTFAADAEAAIAARYFYAGERTQAAALATAAAGANQPLGLWVHGLIAWEKDDGATALVAFNKLKDHPSLNPPTKAAALFWAARALTRQGDAKGGRALLADAARQPRSFYGLLAAQLLGRKPVNGVTKDSLPVWNREHRAVLVAQRAGGRALALVQAGETALAEEELARLDPKGEGELQQAMLALAGFVPMPGLAVKVASLAVSTETALFDRAAYPLPPWRPQHGFTVDRALLYALMRHESRFDPKAVSAQGAMGLMQIMPHTATVMHADYRADEPLSPDLMMDPSLNLALGQRYLTHLASRPRIGDNLILLLAAYNGGPTKMGGFADAQQARLSGPAGKDPLLFLESIPSRETRTYVMRVLPHYWAYRARLGESLTSLRQLAEGQWPRFTLNEQAPAKAQTAAAF